jgi:hypothetical protein
MHEVRNRRLVTLACLVAAGLALTACGGGSSHSAGATTGPTTTTTTAGGPGGAGGFGAALTAFRDCMSSQGVKLAVPTRPANGNGTPRSTTPGETRPARGTGGGRGFGGFGGGNFANRFNTPPAGVDPTKYKAALAACKSKLPTAGANPVNNSAFTAYRSCLSDHGVKLPANGGAGNIDRNSPAVKAALKTCQPLLPAGGFRRGATTTTTAPAA